MELGQVRGGKAPVYGREVKKAPSRNEFAPPHDSKLAEESRDRTELLRIGRAPILKVRSSFINFGDNSTFW